MSIVPTLHPSRKGSHTLHWKLVSVRRCGAEAQQRSVFPVDLARLLSLDPARELLLLLRLPELRQVLDVDVHVDGTVNDLDRDVQASQVEGAAEKGVTREEAC